MAVYGMFNKDDWNFTSLAAHSFMVATMPKVLTESRVNADNARTEEFTGY